MKRRYQENMKSKIAVLSILICVAVCTFALFACGTNHEHKYDAVTNKVLPTCTEKGYTVKSCSCGAVNRTDYVPAKGHNFVNGKCDGCGITNDEYIVATDIKLDQRSVEIEKGATAVLSVIFVPENSTSNVSWSTSVREIATVNNGTVTGIGAGTCIVTAMLPNGKSAVCEVIVFEKTTENLDFEKVDGGYEVSYYSGSDAYVNIPNSHDGLPVIGIGDVAFENCRSLLRVKIPEGIRYLGRRAFAGCNGLTEITVPESVVRVGEKVFDGCGRLKSLYWNAAACEENDFDVDYGISTTVLSEVEFGDRVDKITRNMFYGAKKLESITIPASVKSIGYDAFCNCMALDTVYYSGDLTSWCSVTVENAFANPFHNAHYVYIDGELLTDLEIPESVREIKNFSFCGCVIESVVIHRDVRSIGRDAFKDCRKIERAEMPATAVSAIPQTRLKSVVINNSYHSEGIHFADCETLERVVISEGATKLEANAFSRCTSLAEIVLPESLKTVGAFVFNSCALTSIDLSANVTELEYGAFDDCNSLAVVNYAGDLAGWCSITFENYTSNPLQFARSFNIDGKPLTQAKISGVTKINDNAFFGFGGLTSVDIASGVESIGANAFFGCVNLESVSIDDSVTFMGNNAFGNCISLGSVTLGNGIAEISVSAFEGCSALENLKMGSSVETIGYEAFKGCSRLASVQLPATVKVIGHHAFEDCSSLVSVNIPSGLTKIGNDTFKNCSAFESIIIPLSVKYIGDSAFSRCFKLTAYCEAGYSPSGWSSNWSRDLLKVVWNYKNS